MSSFTSLVSERYAGDQYGTPGHGHHHHRREFVPNPIHAVVVRKWNHRGDGPGGNTVFLTNTSVRQPLHTVDDDDDHSLIENGYMKKSKQPWDVGHPPQKTAQAVRVLMVFTLLVFALATAYRWLCDQEEAGGEPVGWQRWRRQGSGHATTCSPSIGLQLRAEA